MKSPFVTQDEAREMWCPMSRVMVTVGDGVPAMSANRFDLRDHGASDLRGNATCIGDACMGWREVDLAKGTGYCGYAGYPK